VTVETSKHSEKNAAQEWVTTVVATTETAYAAPVTTVVGPTGAVSKSTVDVLGRLKSQQQCGLALVIRNDEITLRG
jgi:hypothetical protein